MSRKRFNWTSQDALMQNTENWSTVLDLTKANSITSVTDAANKLNSDEIFWAHSVAFVKSTRVNKWFKLVGKPIMMVNGTPTEWTLDKTAKILENDYNPLLDYSSQSSNSVSKAIELLNSNSDWKYDVAFVNSISHRSWYKLWRNRIYDTNINPVPVIKPVPILAASVASSPTLLWNTNHAILSNVPPSKELDYTVQANNSVREAVKLLNNPTSTWKHDTAYVFSNSKGNWYKLSKQNSSVLPDILSDVSPSDSASKSPFAKSPFAKFPSSDFQPITKRTNVIAFDFDMTLTNIHLYSEWSKKSKAAKKYLLPNVFLDMMDDLNELLIRSTSVPVNESVKYLRIHMENLQRNHMQLCIVTYGIKAIVVEFFKRIGMNDIFNESNILGWKEGFTGVEGFDGKEIYETTVFSAMSKRGKNDFITNFIRSKSIDINNSDVYLVDDTVNNIIALDVLKAQYPLAKFTGITDMEEKKKGTDFYISALKTALEAEGKLSSVTVMAGGDIETDEADIDYEHLYNKYKTKYIYLKNKR